MDYRYYNTIDSTNNEAKRIIAAENLSSPLLLIAGAQTAGRGRQGKSFYSPEGTGLYMTLAIPLNCPIASQVTLTTRVAVAVAKAIEKQFGITPAIKWVNDIYVNDHKTCGILCEAVNDYDLNLLQWAVIGVGVNIATKNWPEELSGVAGSIVDDTKLADRCPAFEHANEKTPGAFALSISNSILEMVDDMSEIGYLEYYREHSNVLGQEITFTENGMTRTGRALNVDATGGLIVETTDFNGQLIKKVLNSGEISVRVSKGN